MATASLITYAGGCRQKEHSLIITCFSWMLTISRKIPARCGPGLLNSDRCPRFCRRCPSNQKTFFIYGHLGVKVTGSIELWVPSSCCPQPAAAGCHIGLRQTRIQDRDYWFACFVIWFVNFRDYGPATHPRNSRNEATKSSKQNLRKTRNKNLKGWTSCHHRKGIIPAYNTSMEFCN